MNKYRGQITSGRQRTVGRRYRICGRFNSVLSQVFVEIVTNVKENLSSNIIADRHDVLFESASPAGAFFSLHTKKKTLKKV